MWKHQIVVAVSNLVGAFTTPEKFLINDPESEKSKHLGWFEKMRLYPQMVLFTGIYEWSMDSMATPGIPAMEVRWDRMVSTDPGAADHIATPSTMGVSHL